MLTQRVRAAITYIIGKATPQPPSTERGLTPRAQVVVTLAISEGWRSSTDHYVGTEHLLLRTKAQIIAQQVGKKESN